jgi:membrane associated rhomboid family serine protease
MTSHQPGVPSAAAPPVCPRHPDRISYVRCQRCGRPVCPECQRQAAVGVHCVDCVRDAARTAPTPRTAFGAPLRDGRPLVTYTLIGLNIVSYVLQMVVAGPRLDWTQVLIFAPFLGEYEPWRFLTAAFLHGSTLHIAFNMFALWVVGQNLELALGRARFLALYGLAAVGGAVMVLLLASPDPGGDWTRGLVGASGAVFGLFGAILLVLRRLGRSARPIVTIIAINAVIGFVVPNISWQAHLGGLLVGALLGAGYAYAPRKRRREVSLAVTVGVAVLLAVLAMLRYAAV